MTKDVHDLTLGELRALYSAAGAALQTPSWEGNRTDLILAHSKLARLIREGTKK